MNELKLMERILKRIADGEEIAQNKSCLDICVSQMQTVYNRDDIFKTVCNAYYLGLSKGYNYRKRSRH